MGMSHFYRSGSSPIYLSYPHWFCGMPFGFVSDGSLLTTGGDDKKREQAGMTKKGIKVLKRTGVEDRYIF